MRLACPMWLVLLVACQEPHLGPSKGAPSGSDLPGGADGDGGDDDPGSPGEPGPLTAAGLTGIYDLSGQQAPYGNYTGVAEIRYDAASGRYLVIHTLRFTIASFEGLAIAQAWQGALSTMTAPLEGEVVLERARFIEQYGGVTRTEADRTPQTLRFVLSRDAGGGLSVAFREGQTPRFSETWTYRGPSAATPIWQNERQLIPIHEPLSEDDKELYSSLFSSFHELPDVVPYVDRPEFDAAVNHVVFDPTDFAYLRQNPLTVRVIQAILDPVSLMEATLRHRGYAFTLARKAELFDAAAPTRYINGAGFMANFSWASMSHVQSGDALLWTGMYIASQAMRYLTTGAPAALDNVTRSLDAILLCHDITQQPGVFCRSLRPHVVDGDPKWLQAAPPYQHLDWLQGGNNDMAHGLATGMLWGWKALQRAGGDSTRKERIIRVIEDMLEHSDIVGDGEMTETRWQLFLYMMTGDFEPRLRYEIMFSALESLIIEYGNGTTYTKGLSLDASGTHLTLLGLWDAYTMASDAGHDHAYDYRVGLRNGLEIMKQNRLGLYQLVAGTLGDFPAPPPQLEAALWTLREFPVVKQDFDIDHRISRSFCLAPWPALPWKQDWEQEDRTRSIVSYPLFEKSLDQDYQWKNGPNMYRSYAGSVEGAAVDFLVAYWFGRYHGVITPEM